MHGSASGVCTTQQVKELQREFPKAHVFEVAGAAHPVPFSASVNQFVLQSLNLPAAPQTKPESVREVAVPMPMPMPMHKQLDMQLDMPLEIPVEAPAPQTQHHHAPNPAPKPRMSLLGLLKQLLGATKK
jgi:hypothetical protein